MKPHRTGLNHWLQVVPLSGNKIQFKHNTKSKNLEFDNVYDIDSSLSIFLYLLYTFYIINIVKL